MRKFQSKPIHVTLLIGLSILSALSLAAVIVMRFPAFYDQDTAQKAFTFGAVFTGMLLLILLANKAFILPYLLNLLQRENLAFIGLMLIIIGGTLGISSAHYWSVPEVHAVEICFDTTGEEESVRIQKLVDPSTNRLYSPASFGNQRYPLSIDSGECIRGSVTDLVSPLTQALMAPGLTVVYPQVPAEGRFYISVNDTPAVILFEEADEIITDNQVTFRDGFDQGRREVFPWRQAWFLGLKALAVLLSAAYLSLCLYGLTERTLTYSALQTAQPDGN